MGSISECRIEGFICRLCSQIDRNVIHIYTDEGLQKKLEQKINVYLKINLSRYDPLPKVICLPCDAKLEQHHRFIQRVIQNQKKIQGERPGERPIIPLLEQHLRVRVSGPVVREDGTGTNTYNIEAISSSDSDTTDSENFVFPSPDVSLVPTNDTNENAVVEEEVLESSDSDNYILVQNEALPSNQANLNYEDINMELSHHGSSSSSSTSSPSNSSFNDQPLVGFSPNLQPVDAPWSSSSSTSTSSSSSDSDSNEAPDVIGEDEIC